MRILDKQSGVLTSGALKAGHPYGLGNGQNVYGTLSGNVQQNFYASQGGASRFFYCAKAGKKERNLGCEEFESKAKCEIDKMGGEKCSMKTGSGNDRNVAYKNNHPTVKPIALMEYLIKLVTKPEAIILDPFLGSGTTLLACYKLNRNGIGIEKKKNISRLHKHD